MKNILFYGSIVLGVVLVGLGIYYFITPAGSLPTYLPGYSAASTTIHIKHGIGSIILGLAAFAYAWFAGGARTIVSPTLQ
jgi:hypothetical protein